MAFLGALGVQGATCVEREASASEAEETPQAEGVANGTFIDLDGRVRELRPFYDAWHGPDRRPANYPRATLEVMGIVGLGTLYYWMDPLANKEDWDDPRLVDRVTLEAVSFDTNLNTTNHFLHPGAGAFVYGFSRINGLSVPMSFLYSAFASAAWEFALEWREQISINDMIFTPIGGVALGQFFVSLGDYVNSAPRGGTGAQAALAHTIGLPRRLHTLADDEKDPPFLPLDNLGFSSAYGHDFRLALRGAMLSNEQGAQGFLVEVGGDAEIVAMPGFLRPGRFGIGFGEGNFTEGHLRLGWGNTGLENVDLDVSTTLFGHYAQDIDTKHRGYAFMFGGGPGLRFNATTFLGRPDQNAAARIFGPRMSAWVLADKVLARFDADITGDLAGIQSIALPQYRAQYGDDGVKPVLQKQGYGYNLGWSGRARAEIAAGPVSLGGRVEYGRYTSIDVGNRGQEDLDFVAGGDEEILDLRGWVGLRPWGPIDLRLGAGERVHRSTIGVVSTTWRDYAIDVSAGLRF